MTLEESQAENAALRELLAAIADARPPAPADYSSRDTERHRFALSDRMSAVVIAARSAAGYAGPARLGVIRDCTETVRRENARPLRYKAEAAQDETPAAVAP